MKKFLGMFTLSLWSMVAMAQDGPANLSVEGAAEALKTMPVAEGRDLPFPQFDSIVKYGSLLKASKILFEDGFKLAYGDEVKQKKRYFSELAFVKGADYDETGRTWITVSGVPYTYIRLFYDDESQQICHYQIKFRNRIGYSLFFGEAFQSGYYPEKIEKNSKWQKSVYYRDDGIYIMFSEYANNTFFVDCWPSWSPYKIKK